MSRSKSGKRGKREKLASKPLVSKMRTVPEDGQDLLPQDLPPQSSDDPSSSAGSNCGARSDRTSEVNSVAASDSSIGQPPAPAAAGQPPTAVVHQAPLPATPIVPVQQVLAMQQLQSQIVQMNAQMNAQNAQNAQLNAKNVQMNAQMNAQNAQTAQLAQTITQLRRELQAAQRCSCCMS